MDDVSKQAGGSRGTKLKGNDMTCSCISKRVQDLFDQLGQLSSAENCRGQKDFFPGEEIVCTRPIGRVGCVLASKLAGLLCFSAHSRRDDVEVLRRKVFTLLELLLMSGHVAGAVGELRGRNYRLAVHGVKS